MINRWQRGGQLYGWELEVKAQLPRSYCVGFCKVGGNGDTSSIFLYSLWFNGFKVKMFHISTGVRTYLELTAHYNCFV